MVTVPILKQFVPSNVCLQCEGCCRFQTADSAWRPKFNKKEFTDDQDYVTTIADCGRHLCRFFNKGDSTCRTYHDRPFECELYPFLLSQESDGVKVYVHLACPYIQDHETDPALGQYIEYLRRFFTRPETIEFLRRNRRYVQNYRPVSDETRYLFDLPQLSDTPQTKVSAENLLEQKPRLDHYLALSPWPLSCYHFSSIFAWKDFFQASFTWVSSRFFLCWPRFMGLNKRKIVPFIF